jgi:DNA polymerase III subunit gamma/tau
MSYIALYRKWRPLVFDDIVEQEHVVRTLKNSIITGRISHAYLFSGTRGTGKTTTAHILARAVNCLNPSGGNPCNSCESCKGILSGSILDVMEIDAASNNSVDNVREIREEVVYSPTSTKYKVYIIDEVHMLSTGAFNALLKTLEEPPSHVIFILATTEPHKLPVTVLSRCQKFEFRRIPVKSIAGRLDKIAAESGVELCPEASMLIARLADGALRDAISLLDQCIIPGETEIKYEKVVAVAGLVQEDLLSDVVDALISRDTGKLLSCVDILISEGKEVSRFLSDLVLYFRNLLICSTVASSRDIIETSPDMQKRMQAQCEKFTRERLVLIIKELSETEASLKWSVYPRVQLEVCLIKICEGITGVKAEYIEGSTDKSNVSYNSENKKNNVAKQKPEVKIKTDTGTYDIDKHDANRDTNNGDDFKDIWNEVLQQLKSMGRMKLFLYLSGTHLVKTGEKQFCILFNDMNRINMPVVRKSENITVIEEYLGKKLGCDIRVLCRDEEIKAEVKKGSDDEFIKKVKDTAKKLNAPVNIIDD